MLTIREPEGVDLPGAMASQNEGCENGEKIYGDGKIPSLRKSSRSEVQNKDEIRKAKSSTVSSEEVIL